MELFGIFEAFLLRKVFGQSIALLEDKLAKFFSEVDKLRLVISLL